MLTKEQLTIVQQFGTRIELEIFWNCFTYEQQQKQYRPDYNGQPANSFYKSLSLQIADRCLGV
jgi:hypothetical protein